ncbi:MAG: HAD-IA family hydrolase [Acidobacteria bacterium]|nr:HAD-IA family hydrolase [Acidobacteriota bacterium]
MDENKINLFLFDFDGTLVNTTPLILRAFRATWERVFGFVYEDSQYIKTFGLLLPKAMRLLTEQAIAEARIGWSDNPQGKIPKEVSTDFLEAKSEELTEVYRAFTRQWHDEMIEPFEGIEETLRELRARGLSLGVVSSKMRAGLLRGLDAYQMAGNFDVIVAGDDCENHKPHPEPLLRALGALNKSRDEVIYIGDSAHDIAAGRAARVRTAAAAWGPFPRNELAQSLPDYLLDNPKDLLTIFNR